MIKDLDIEYRYRNGWGFSISDIGISEDISRDISNIYRINYKLGLGFGLGVNFGLGLGFVLGLVLGFRVRVWIWFRVSVFFTSIYFYNYITKFIFTSN